MNPNNTPVTADMIAKYMTLKTAIKDLTKEADELNEIILADLVQSGADEISTDDGKISLSKRKKWTLPAELTARKEQLDADIKVAQQVGTATFTEEPYLLFKAKKD